MAGQINPSQLQGLSTGGAVQYIIIEEVGGQPVEMNARQDQQIIVQGLPQEVITYLLVSHSTAVYLNKFNCVCLICFFFNS